MAPAHLQALVAAFAALVHHQRKFASKRFATLSALEGLASCVRAQVAFRVGKLGETRGTESAAKRLLPCVNSVVNFETAGFEQSKKQRTRKRMMSSKRQRSNHQLLMGGLC
jgi:hypothetical protein